MKYTLHWSRWEIGFVTVCHLTAALSVLFSELLAVLMLLALLGVAGSYFYYLRAGISTYLEFGHGAFYSQHVQLVLLQQSATLNYRGSLWETRLPVVSYFSEFLIVLSLPEAEQVDGGTAASKPIHLVLWPDSLSRAELKRLRRYLRFELPFSLGEH